MTRLVLVAFGVVLTGNILGAQSGSTVWVSTRVESQCRVTGGRLDFGDYDPINRNSFQPLDAEATFQVQCTPGTVARVGLESGLHASFGGRRMVAIGGRDVLEYDLYSDVGRTVLWAPGTTVPFQQIGSQPRRVAVFGRVSPSQDVSVGDYEDSVLIVVRF